MPLLELKELRTGYGAVPVLHGVNMTIEEGETAVLLGLNGAGKTTTLMTIAGLLRSWGGDILFDGKPIGSEDARTLVGRGIVLVPEGRRVFPALSVQNNLRLGAWSHRRDHKLFRKNMDRGFEIFPVLKERRGQMAGTLSGGEQQMLAIGRALMAKPTLLLLDEPSMGLAPMLVQQIFSIIGEINKQGTTILLVEQNANQALAQAVRGYVIENGAIVLSDSAGALRTNDRVRKSYLGES